jgi:hypothetical protein
MMEGGAIGRLFLRDAQEDQKHIDILRVQRNKLAMMSRDYKRTKLENERLSKENAQIRDAFDSLSKTTNKLDSETKKLIFDLRTDNDTLQNDLYLMKEENNKLNQLIDQITENNEIWRQKNKETEEESQRLLEESTHKDQVVQELRESLLTIEKRNRELEEKVCYLSQMEVHFERSEFNNKMVSKQCDELTRINDDLQARVRGQELNSVHMHDTNSENMRSKDQEIALLQDELTCSVNEIQTKAKLISMQEEIIATLKEEVNMLRVKSTHGGSLL